MQPKDNFNPVDSAAMNTRSLPVKKQIAPAELASLPPLLKNRPIIPPPKKPKATMEHGEYKFPDNNDPYWKKHPLQTEHSDGTVRTWGDDTLKRNPNVLPKQMLPPRSVEPKDQH